MRFIKSRNSNTTVVLLTFNLQEQPYTLCIPGKQSDTAVYKYQDRVMVCHICHKYNTLKQDAEKNSLPKMWRRWPHKWQHKKMPKWILSVQTVEYVISREMTAAKLKWKKGQLKNSSLQQIEKTKRSSNPGGRRWVYKFQTSIIPWHFRCKMDPEKKFNPLAIKNSFTQELGSKPATTRPNNESEFVIEI